MNSGAYTLFEQHHCDLCCSRIALEFMYRGALTWFCFYCWDALIGSGWPDAAEDDDDE